MLALGNSYRIKVMLSIHIIDAKVSMMSIFHMEEICAFLDVVGAAEKGVDFLEGDFLCFRNEVPNEGSKENVHGKEEVECFLSRLLAYEHLLR